MYHKIRKIVKQGEILGYTVASSTTAIAGDYIATGNTFNNGPTYYCSAKSMYLFLSTMDQWGMTSYVWTFNSTLLQSLGEYNDETWEFNYYDHVAHAGYSSEDFWDWTMMHEEYSDADYMNPPTEFFSTAGWNDANSSSISATFTDLRGPSTILADHGGYNIFGDRRNIYAGKDIPFEDLAFAVQFLPGTTKASTGQTLTMNMPELSENEEDQYFDDSDSTTPFRDAWGLKCIKTGSRNNGNGTISFPDDAINVGRGPLSVSIWFGWFNAVYYSPGTLFCIGNSSGYMNFCISGESWYEQPFSIGAHDQYINWSLKNGDGNDGSKWHHGVWVFTGRQLDIYVDGVYRGNTGCDVEIKRGGTAYIASSFDSNNKGSAHCLIAGVRVYNKVLNSGEVDRLYGEYKRNLTR